VQLVDYTFSGYFVKVAKALEDWKIGSWDAF
jgi:hypothetical protein